MAIAVSQEEMLVLGMRSRGHSDTKINRAALGSKKKIFRSNYGISAVTAASIFQDIQRVEKIGDNAITNPRVIHFLMTLFWLRAYPTEDHLNGSFGLGPKAARAKRWVYVKALAALKPHKVPIILSCLLFATLYLHVDGSLLPFTL